MAWMIGGSESDFGGLGTSTVGRVVVDRSHEMFGGKGSMIYGYYSQVGTCKTSAKNSSTCGWV